MAYLKIVGLREAEGELLETYRTMLARPMPDAYRPSHGDAAGIQRAHSLDPRLMRLVFSTSATHQPGPHLTWAERELVAASASRTNECVY